MRGKMWKGRLGLGLLALAIVASPGGWVGKAAAAEAAAAPDISYATEGVDEGGSFVLTGDHFTADAEVWLYRPAKDDAAALKASFGQAEPLPAEPPEGAVKTEVLGTPEEHLLTAAQIGYPNLAPSISTVPTIVWVKTDAGYSAPYMLNRPELYFAASSSALPGERLRVFGRNLETRFEVAGADYDLPVALKNKATGNVIWAQTLMEETQEQANVKAYVLNALVPNDAEPGDYEMYVHTLYGGSQGWSDPLDIRIASSRDLTASLARESDIKLATPARGAPGSIRTETVNGLKADGVSDDSDKVQKAIDKMSEKGGGIVILPPGNIAIGKTLRIKPSVVLSGSGKASTQLVVAPNRPLSGSFPIDSMFASPDWVRGFSGDYAPYLKDRVPMVWMDDKTGLQDLSVLTGAGADIGVLVGSDDPSRIVRDTFIKRTEIVNRHMLYYPVPEGWGAYMGGVLVVSPTEGFTMTDNRVTGDESLFMLSGSAPHEHARIANNEFETAVNNGSDNVFINSLADSIIENNRIDNGARAITSQLGMWRNWISGNVIAHTGGRANASEMLMSENGYVKPLASANAVSADASSVTLSVDLPAPAGDIAKTAVRYYAFVAAGTGMGQYRMVTDNPDKRTLTLDRPWRVKPDATSRIDVIQASVKNLFVNNWISDSRGSLQFSYGAGLDNIVAGNNLNNTGSITVFGGLDDWTDADHPYLGITAYNQIYANFLANSGGIYLTGNTGKDHAYGDAVLTDTGGFFANTVRRNQVWSRTMSGNASQYYNVWMNGEQSGIPYEGAINVKDAAFTVIEGNYIDDSSIGIQLNGGKNAVIRQNRMDDVTTRVSEQNGAAGTVKQPPSWEPPY